MANEQKYIKIKDKDIPVIVRNYRKSNKLGISFRGNILNISKPTFLKFDKMMKIIKDNEEQIYSQYIKIFSTDNKNIKHWKDGEKILYQGEEYKIIRERIYSQKIQIYIDKDKKELKISIPTNLTDEQEIKKNVDIGIKKLFKNNTQIKIQERLPYWSKKTGIEYSTLKIRDAICRFGSCVPATKALHFSSRLIMLPEDKIDAIIVHELCHIIHKNHSKDFYNLVKKYIPNYEEIDKWLKQNGKLILI